MSLIYGVPCNDIKDIEKIYGGLGQQVTFQTKKLMEIYHGMREKVSFRTEHINILDSITPHSRAKIEQMVGNTKNHEIEEIHLAPYANSIEALQLYQSCIYGIALNGNQHSKRRIIDVCGRNNYAIEIGADELRIIKKELSKKIPEGNFFWYIKFRIMFSIGN